MFGSSQWMYNSGSEYTIEQSLRLDKASGAYLERTQDNGDRKKFTASFWVKRPHLDTDYIFNSKQHLTGAYPEFHLGFRADKIRFIATDASNNTHWILDTEAAFRDTSAWHHIVAVFDSDNDNEDDRAIVYCNGARLDVIWGIKVPHHAELYSLNNAGIPVHINKDYYATGNDEYDNYLAEFHYIDGQALDPTYFGEINEDYGHWVAKEFKVANTPKGSYGTNGFYLDFDLSQDIGIEGTYSTHDIFGDSSAVATYLFDGDVTDEGGNYDGTAYNVSYVDGLSGTQAAVFTESPVSYVDIANISQSTSKSYSIWFKTPQTTAWDTILYFHKGAVGSTSSSDYVLQVGTYAGRLSWYHYGSYDITTGPMINDNKWHNIVVYYPSNGVDIKIYLDGKLAHTCSQTSLTYSHIRLGRTHNVSSDPTTGIMDQLRVFNRELSLHEMIVLTGGYGSDKSGNQNSFIPNNLSPYDIVPDSPNNNFCIFNWIDRGFNENSSYFLKNGGLQINGNGGGAWSAHNGTFSLSSGKWYYEVRVNSSNIYAQVGFQSVGYINEQGDGAYRYRANGTKAGTYSSYGAAWDSAGAVIGCAVDCDNRTVTFYKNGVSQGVAFTNIILPVTPIMCTAQNSDLYANFGQDSTFDSSESAGTNTDGKGYFKYAVPTGYKSMCTANLPEPAVKPKENFNTVLYAATGLDNLEVRDVGFKPDLVWIKNRTLAGRYHNVYDVVRGPSKRLQPTDTNAETTVSGVKSFDSDGFTLGNQTDDTNYSRGYTFVSWNWKSGGTGVTNTDGSITSTVSANPDAGFSIVNYTFNSSKTNDVGHGLNQAPEMIFMKSRTTAYNWDAYHPIYSGSNRQRLNTSEGEISGFWAQDPDDTKFYVAYNNASNGDQIIAYCWHSVEGYSKIGDYLGNGSTDGTFVHTGFRPAFVIIKSTTTARGWVMLDNKRDAYNPEQQILWANLSNAEAAYGTGFDFLSNGIKFKEAANDFNASGVKYIYMAFAEYPFKYSNARGTSYDKETGVEPSTNTINQSLRLNRDGYLTRTPSAASNRTTWTFSTWLKRSSTDGGEYYIFGGTVGGWSDVIRIFQNKLQVYLSNSGGSGYHTAFGSAALFRDPSAWYHLTAVWDSNNSVAGDRLRMYINGDRITDLDGTNVNPSQGEVTYGINTTQLHVLGIQSDGTIPYDNPWHGYLADTHFIDGQALGPEHFGYSDPTYGDWRPKAYEDNNPEPNYGPNGFRLTYNSGSARIDQSGMGNHWTVNNFSETTDVVLDSPTNNFATYNPSDPCPYALSEGNLKSYHNNQGWASRLSTIFVNSGKWYFEVMPENTDNWGVIGVAQPGHNTNGSHMGAGSGLKGLGWVFNDTGTRGDITYNNINSSYTNGSIGVVGINDVLAIALDLDNNKVMFYKNNTKYFELDNLLETDAYYTFGVSHYFGQNWRANFGQDSSFAGAKTGQGNQDSNGEGDFYYAPPTGFLALCNNNLPNPTVVPKENFDTLLWTGTNAEHKLTGLNFQPDFMWFKKRTGQDDYHALVDTVRGATGSTKVLDSSQPNAEYTTTNGILSINSDGYTLVGTGSGSGVFNGNLGHTYASWNWKASGTTVTNTNGTITSTVSANPDAGFSIVSYTGTGANATVGHGLDSTPEVVIVKNRSSSSYNWPVYHKDLSTALHVLVLNTTDAETTVGSGGFFTSSPSSTVLNLGYWGGVNTTQNYIAYCFHSVDGFSKFGEYDGNDSDDGPFIYTGFRPAFVMIKCYAGSGGQEWVMYDSERDSGNPTNHYIYANYNYTESTGRDIDFLSNGFKVTLGASGATNTTGRSYIYMAFAEYPFKRTNSR
jgi:hypothetical protein